MTILQNHFVERNTGCIYALGKKYLLDSMCKKLRRFSQMALGRRKCRTHWLLAKTSTHENYITQVFNELVVT